MTIPSDEPTRARAGEELDPARLEAYLAVQVPELAGPIEVLQFPHGHSNLTYLVRAGGQEWVLRRPPAGNRVKTAHDMGREYHVLSQLWPIYPPAPKPLCYCDDPAVIGAPFYLMERRHGAVLRGGRACPLDPPALRKACEALVDNLARLHALDHRAAGLAELGKPQGYIERQVRGWSQRFRDAQTEPIAEMDHLAGWLEKKRPAEAGEALIHNDYKFDNLLFDPARPGHIVAVLDWEMCTIGDPLMDLGTTLAYWVEPNDSESLKQLSPGPSDQPGSLTRAELAERYFQQSGRAGVDLLFYYVFGLFKIAVIVQQIFARYARGVARDERFAHLDQVVRARAQSAARVSNAGRF